jgi:hypothetical protein
MSKGAVQTFNMPAGLQLEEDMGATDPGVKAYWFDVLRLPARIFAAGFSILILALAWKYTIGTSFAWSSANSLDASWAALVVAALVFAAGVGLIIMLWWLTARYFHLIGSGAIDSATITVIKDLPMGLPEGTVRAILALIVGMIGLPVLVFQGVLDLDQEVAGYVNGIVAGVFGFYFGTRTSGVPTSAVDKIADAHQVALDKADEAAGAKAQAADAKVQAADAMSTAEAIKADAKVVKADAEAAKADAEAVKADAELKASAQTEELRRATDAGTFESNLSKAARHLALLDTIMKQFSVALPQEVIPAGMAEMFANAEKTVAALRGVAAADVTQEQFDQLANIADALTGSASPISTLLKNAAPLLANVSAVPGLGQVASLVTLLGIGAKLGSSQYQRWRARVLASPVSQRLVEFGTMTPDVIHAALKQAPILSNALAQLNPDQVESDLANIVASSDPAGDLLAAFGPQGKTRPDLVSDAAVAQAGIAQLQQALLSLYSANDVQPATVQLVADALASPALPELANVQNTLRGLAPSSVNQLVDAVSGISANTALPEGQRAAFDALVSLVDAARSQNIDLVAILAELKQ